MKLKIKLTSESNIRYYSPDTNWIAFSAKVLDIIDREEDDLPIDVNKMIAISGNILFKPEVGVEYLIEGVYEQNSKWGLQFKIDNCYQDVSLKTDEDKRAFLKEILTEKQFENLYATYSDPFVLIEENNISALCAVDGIGDYLANKIVSKFQSTLDIAPAINFFKPLGLTMNLINKLCRTYKGAIEAIQVFKDNPYVLASDVDGVGFIKADAIAREYKFDMKSPFRIEAGICHMLKDNANSNGSTWMTSNKFKKDIISLLGIEFDTIVEVFKQMVKNEILYVDKENGKISLKYFYDLERKIKDRLIALLTYQGPKLAYSDEDDEYYDCTYTEDTADYSYEDYINEAIMETEQKQGFEFTDEQKNGIMTVLQKNVVIVIGSAGTGKTSVIKGAYEAFAPGTLISQCAFSGQASKRINEATGYPSSTIHRLLGYNGTGFEHDSECPLSSDVVVLDEVSMVGLELFWSLIRAIPLGSKLVMLGDSGQLPPIGVGNLLSDLIHSNVIPLVELTKIHRQAAKSAIITTSQDVRHRKRLLEPEYEGDETLGELQDLTIYARQEKEELFDIVIETFMDEYNKSENTIKDIQIIVAQNQRVTLSREKINKVIQAKINPAREGEPEINIRNQDKARIGDKIINRKNHYNVKTTDYELTSIFNGSMGIIKEITNKHIVVNFFDEGEVIITPDMYLGLELAYAITCHSSQGSQYKVVIVGFDYSSYIMLSNEWLYTAITRAKDKCYLIAETRAINKASTNNKILGRRTFLPEFFGSVVDDENIVYEGEE